MATSGSFTTTSFEGRSLTFSWNRTNYSIANNTSTIAWSVTGSGSYTAGWVTCGDIDVVVNGVTVYNSSAESRVNVWSGTVVASGTAVITHGADGNKSFSASVKAAIYNYAQNCNGSGTWSLNTIPRASNIDKVTNTSGTGITTTNTGNDIRVYFTPKSTSFKYRVTVSMNGFSAQNNSSGVTVTATSQQYYQVNIPHTWIPNNVSATLTCKLETLNGTTVIGTNTKTISMTVPATVVPTLGTLSSTPINSNTTISGWGIYVAGYSKARITCSASGNNGSTIKSFQITGSDTATVNGTSLSRDITLSSGGSKTFTVKAIDSRGRSSATKSITINVQTYSTPSIQSFNVVRTDTSGNASDGGTSAKLSSVGYYSNIGSNAATATFAYKLSTATSFTNIGNSIAGTSGSISGNIILSSITFAAASEYDFKITITDSLGNSVSRTVRLGSVSRTLNIAKYGNGIAVGKMSTIANASDAGKFECGWNADFDRNVNIDGGLDVGSTTVIKGTLNANTNIMAKNHIYMGGNFESTGEKHVKFNTGAGTYQHNVYIYGANPAGENAIGIYDAKNSRHIFYYNDVANSLNIGQTTNVNINGSPIKDIVIEQSLTDGWSYRKWSSGAAECWRNVSVNPTNTNALNSITVNLPFTFANTNYLVQITPAKVGLNISAFGDCATNNSVSHTTTSFVMSYFYNHGTIYTVNFNVSVTGRWK